MIDVNLHGHTFNHWCKSAGYTIPDLCRLPSATYQLLRDDWRSGREPAKRAVKSANQAATQITREMRFDAKAIERSTVHV